LAKAALMHLTEEDFVHLAKSQDDTFLTFRDRGFSKGQDAGVSANMERVHKRVMAETLP